MFKSGQTEPFGLLLDPDTGIPLPDNKGASLKHASLDFIVALEKETKPVFIICFDQSYHRKHELPKYGQLDQKRKYLKERGLSSFYYLSHAPFLFAARNAKDLHNVIEKLSKAGIPKTRIHSEGLTD